MQESEAGFSVPALGQSFSTEEMGRITLLAQKRQALTVNDISVFKEGITALKKEKERIAERETDDFAAAILRRRREAEKRRGEPPGSS